ncbi:hypothetical protein C900_02886 [Fulvivirga imtechensis AK7]|uniref:WG repeat-containing protein n=1 Tax=Fulvivirga imtechensis AK7 TaxID=1237149 RepID=L8JQP9_9BACT|nr:WG repeat-containing protein [Fulvivirga imtechensis]ELR71271.1 hypothetical protein C900_02886 [Fulvivirga imtechensis AK7]
MKDIFYLLIFVFFSSSFFTDLTAFPSGSADYQLFEREGKQGLKDNEGNILISASYDELGWSKGPFEVFNNVLGYRQGSQWGVISLQNEIIIANRFSQLYPGAKNMLIAGIKDPASHRHLMGVVTIEGKEVLPFQYASIRLTDLRAIVSTRQGSKYVYGVVDFDNKTVIPSQYADISFLGSLRFAVRNGEGKTAIFNDKGKQVLGFELDSISNFRHGYALTYENHLRGLINLDGAILQPVKYKDFKVSGDGVKALDFNQWHVISNDNQELKRMRYDALLPYGKGLTEVRANDKTWLINTEAEALTPKNYDQLKGFDSGFVAFRIDSRWGVMDDQYNVLMPARFDSVFLSEGMIYTREMIHGKLMWSMYDELGVKKSHYNYDEIGKRTSHLYPVKRQGHWGFIDRSGEEVIHCVYDEVSPFVDGLSAVGFHREFGIVDKTGDWIVLPQKARIRVINDQYYVTNDGRLTTLKSLDEGTIYFTENPLEIKENYLLEHLSDGTIWKIDFQGRMVKPAFSSDRYQEVRAPSEGFYAAKIDGKYGFIDAQNRLRIANRYDEAGSFSEGLAAVKLMGRWGFIDKLERLVIQPLYNKEAIFKNGLAVVSNDKGSGLITPEGKPACPFDFDAIERLDNGRFIAKKGNKTGLINESGRIIINVKYEELQDLNNGYAIVKLFGQYGLVDLNGVDIIPIAYDQLIYDPNNGNYLAMKKSQWESVSLP